VTRSKFLKEPFYVDLSTGARVGSWGYVQLQICSGGSVPYFNSTIRIRIFYVGCILIPYIIRLVLTSVSYLCSEQ
jgi:hypothetical protein